MLLEKNRKTLLTATVVFALAGQGTLAFSARVRVVRSSVAPAVQHGNVAETIRELDIHFDTSSDPNVAGRTFLCREGGESGIPVEEARHA